MKHIQIINKFGINVTVDDDDYERCCQYRWTLLTSGYARANMPGKPTVLMHRWLIKAAPQYEVHHINGNRLDNRKENLQLVSHSNNQHLHEKRKGTVSRFKGVSWNKSAKRWQVFVRTKYIGVYKTEVEAALAYNKEARRVYGDKAFQNDTST